MKIACAGWGFRQMGMRKYFEEALALGTGFVEVNCSENVPEHLSPKATLDEAREMTELARSIGVKVVALAAGNDFTVADGAMWNQHVASVKHVIDLAQAAGAEVVRIFAGWAEELADAVFKRAARGIREVGEYAKTRGVVLGIENHGGITGTGESCAKLLDLVGDLDAVGLTYDPANFAYTGADPLRGLTAVGERVTYCHLKDVRRDLDGKPECCAFGEGEIDWPPILAGLRAFYGGYLAIEYERAEDAAAGTRRSLENLHPLLEA